MQKPSRRTLIICAAGLLVILAGVAMALGPAADLLPDLGLLPSSEGAVGGGGSAVSPAGGTPKAQDAAREPATKAPNDETGQGPSAADPAGAVGKPDKPGVPPLSGGTESPGTGTALMVNWWNDTSEKTPSKLEVVYGSQVIKPDATKSHSVGSLGPFPVETAQTLTLYPDGKGGKRYDVSLTVTRNMQANSEVDAIHIEVADTHIRILGNAIDNFDHTFER